MQFARKSIEAKLEPRIAMTAMSAVVSPARRKTNEEGQPQRGRQERLVLSDSERDAQPQRNRCEGGEALDQEHQAEARLVARHVGKDKAMQRALHRDPRHEEDDAADHAAEGWIAGDQAEAGHEAA
jgi:hypothetical protein